MFTDRHPGQLHATAPEGVTPNRMIHQVRVWTVLYDGQVAAPNNSRAERILPLLAEMRRSTRPLSLADAGEVVDLSPDHLQRTFAAHVGESPDRYQRRLRLERGAIDLRSTNLRIIDVALRAGFESHEAFTRAFTAHFRVGPRDYRKRTERLDDHASRLIESSGPCVGLYGFQRSAETPFSNHHINRMRDQHMPTSDIARETITETPTIVATRRIARENLAEAIGECLPMAYAYALEAGHAMAGPPFVRYVSQTAAFDEIEAGVPLTEPAGTVEHPDLAAGTMPGGDVVTGTHEGSYDSLGESHAALDLWMSEQGLRPDGGPWEVYITDPGEFPDPKDWRTTIIWPYVQRS